MSGMFYVCRGVVMPTNSDCILCGIDSYKPNCPYKTMVACVGQVKQSDESCAGCTADEGNLRCSRFVSLEKLEVVKTSVLVHSINQRAASEYAGVPNVSRV